jgi:hypothetical protein
VKNAAELAGVSAMFAVVRAKSNISRHIQRSPLPAAKVTERLWEIGDIVDVLEAWEQSQIKVARHDTQETR